MAATLTSGYFRTELEAERLFKSGCKNTEIKTKEMLLRWRLQYTVDA